MTEKEIAESIKEQYREKTIEESKLTELKKLDRKVKLPAEIFAYSYGIVGSLVFGTGMCLAMKVIANIVPLGIGVGLLGLLMVATNYSIYKAILKSRKNKYASTIISKSDELLNK